MSMQYSFYEILEIDAETLPADPQEIKKVVQSAFRAAVKKTHPDYNPEDPQAAAEKFAVVKEAYDTLSDPVKREAYDRSLFQQEFDLASDTFDFSNLPVTEQPAGYFDPETGEYIVFDPPSPMTEEEISKWFDQEDDTFDFSNLPDPNKFEP